MKRKESKFVVLILAMEGLAMGFLMYYGMFSGLYK